MAPRFLKKFRFQRAEKQASKMMMMNNRKGGGDGIFRQSKSNNNNKIALVIEPSITWTMSDDSSTIVSPSHSKSLVRGAMVPLQILEHQQRLQVQVQPKAKEQVQVEPASDVVTFTKKQIMQHELNHMRHLAEKEREIISYQKANKELNKRHDEEMTTLRESYQQLKTELLNKTSRVVELEKEIIFTKQELAQVSSVLIQTQDKFHEQAEAMSWRAWLN